MRLTRSRAVVDTSSVQPDEQELRNARVAAARRVPAWSELDPIDLVPRMGGRVVVSAESDRIFTRYAGALWQTGTATAIPDFSPLFFTADGDRLEFYEAQPGTWTARVEQKAERERRRAAPKPRPKWAQR
jgi:hypothetical protein